MTTLELRPLNLKVSGLTPGLGSVIAVTMIIVPYSVIELSYTKSPLV